MEDKQNVCDTKCEHRARLKFSTYFECKKYNKVLLGNPAMKCKECIEGKEPESKEQTTTKKTNKYIPVK